MNFHVIATTRVDAFYDAVAVGDVILVRASKHVHALDRTSLERRWSMELDGKSPQNLDLWSLGDLVIVPNVGADIYAIEPSGGEIVWRGPDSPMPKGMCVYRDHLVIAELAPGTMSLTLTLVDRQGVSVQRDTPYSFVFSVASDGRRLYAGSRHGLLVSEPGEFELHLIQGFRSVTVLLVTADRVVLQCRDEEDRLCLAILRSHDLLDTRLIPFEEEYGSFVALEASDSRHLLLRERGGRWLSMVDFESGQVAWRLHGAGLKIRSCVSTPDGIVGVVEEPRQVPVLCRIDSATGQYSAVDSGLPDGSVWRVSMLESQLLIQWRHPSDLDDHRCYLCEWTDEPVTRPVPDLPPLARPPVSPPRPPQKQTELASLVRAFADCMRARGSERAALVTAFNERFDAWLASNPDQSVGTFAAQVASAGGDPSLHADVLRDLLRIRAGD